MGPSDFRDVAGAGGGGTQDRAERNPFSDIVSRPPRQSHSNHRCPISDLDPDTTEQDDLHGGRSPWFAGLPRPTRHSLTEDIRCDALIVGCGITGALMAERLTRQGLDVVLVDRELPGHGSTAASTSMLLWEIDRSLSELTELYGFERAVRAYRASFEAVDGLQTLVRDLELPCDFRAKSSLYLAASEDATSLINENALRARAGLPGTFLDHRALLGAYEITRAGAIVSPNSADCDPMQMAIGLLNVAHGRGARFFETEAVRYDSASRSVGVSTSEGRMIEARHVILATGYVMPDVVETKVQSPSSSWAIATAPQPDRLWRDGVLIWEDSKDYLYARTTRAGRIIIGGEDSDKIIEPDARDALIPAKADKLKQRLQALWPRAELNITHRWAGTFDTTRDGLPLIGPVPKHPNLFAAYGYGGNGITFSYLAAQLLGDLVNGKRSQLLDDFALDRDVAA